MTAPVVVLLFERTFVAPSFASGLRSSWRMYAGLAASWLVLLLLNYNNPRGGATGFDLGLKLHEYWFTEAKVLLLYLKLVCWPWPLAIQYEMPLSTPIGAAAPYLLGVGLLVVATLVLLWRRRAAGFVGATVLLILSPTLVVPIVSEVVAERRMYLPLAAIVALVVVGGYALLAAFARRATALPEGGTMPRWPLVATSVAALAVTGIYGAVSMQRLSAYRDHITMWSDVCRHQPHNLFAFDNLYAAYIEAGKPRKAAELLEDFILRNPDFAERHKLFGAVQLSANLPQQAIDHLQPVAKVLPNDPGVRANLARAAGAWSARRRDCRGHPSAAAPGGQSRCAGHAGYRVVARRPIPRGARTSGAGRAGLARFRRAARAIGQVAALRRTARRGSARAAADHLRQALRIGPPTGELYRLLGIALLDAGDVDDALAEFDQALLLEPDDKAAQAGRQRALDLKNAAAPR